MDKNNTILAGSLPTIARPIEPFSPLVLEFFQSISEQLRHTIWAERDMAWPALGFWLRKKHIESFRASLTLPTHRIGRGIVFHITPTNMTTMFFYSFALSLLAGNNNIVRISPRLLPKVQPFLEVVQQLWERQEFTSLKNANAFISYEQDTELTDFYTNRCDVRLIWGGNETIQNVRLSPLPPQSIELVFADRYSLAIIDAQTVTSLTQDELRNWVHRFYIDSYEADQNACSSPKLICWLSDNPAIAQQAQRRWWQTLAEETPAYDLAPIKVSQKYADAWHFAMTTSCITSFSHRTNEIYVYTLSSLPEDITTLSGKFGQFFQITLPSLELLLPSISKKVQTISTLGISSTQLRKLLQTQHSLGCDRIVPIGQALQMDVHWDGTNVLDFLSRIIG